MLLYAVIFISGGAILALELLASRIMTPYFGVSLYIWTGILSITLVALAIGYWAGGRLAARAGAGQGAAARLLRLYALMPAIAAAAIVAACFAYPHVFTPLARTSLLGGAFVACLILLFVPLIAASAMNPLLVAIMMARETPRTGDAGAGKVFFVSTIGSVAGVLVTAFGLIPHVSNFAAVLAIAVVLGALSLALAGKNLLGAAACIVAVILLLNADAYTDRRGPFTYLGTQWRLEASSSSLFGTVKVFRTVAQNADGAFVRMYFQDGLTQNAVDSQNRSTSFYTYALEALARAHRPDMRSALVLGLGAGMVPMALAKSGVATEVVDIDPSARRMAQAHFGFDPALVRTHEADARTFLRNCGTPYDVIVVDLFHGDGTPDYLVTREFFADLRACLGERGVAVFNTFADVTRPQPYAHVLATLRAEIPNLALYRPAGQGTHVNSFIVASPRPLPAPTRVTLAYVPPRHSDVLWNMLSAPIPLTDALFAGGRVITDAVHPAAHDFADMQMVYRRSVVTDAPTGLLVN